MTALHDLLEREAERVGASGDELESTLARAERRGRRRRAAVVVVVFLPLLVAGALMIRAFDQTAPQPAEPTPAVIPTNGEITMVGTRCPGDPDAVDVSANPGSSTVLCHDLELTLLDLTGESRTRLSEAGFLPEGEALEIAWSPDGSQLAYGSDVLFVATTDGVRKVGTCRQVCFPTWSSDGRLLSRNGSDGLTVIDMETGGSLTSPLRGVMSPDGSRIASEGPPTSETSDLYVANLDGTGEPELIMPAEKAPWRWSIHRWSPDGSSIAVLGKPKRDCPPREVVCPLWLWTMSPDGSDLTVLLKTGRAACFGFHCDLGWSPDGRQLVLAIPGTDGYPDGIYVIDRNGEHLRFLGSGEGPVAWRPEV